MYLLMSIRKYIWKDKERKNIFQNRIEKEQKGMEENKKVRGEDRGTGLRRVQYYITEYLGVR
jgi:hypothetical protein